MFYISKFKDVEKRDYECEVVTPLFLGGAEPKRVELRAPPIKSALRFWWRASNAQGYVGLKNGESTLFGDSGTSYGKSVMRISITDRNLLIGDYKPMPHNNAPPKNFHLSCVLPGSVFQVRLFGTRHHHDIFQLFCILGGLGKRSRRGFGSVNIVSVDGATEENVGFVEKINKLLNDINPNAYRINNGSVQLSRALDNNVRYAFIREIRIGRNYENADNILKMIGQASHDHNSDFTGFARGRERFASPIYVSINKKQNKYYPIVSILNTAFKTNTGHGIDQSKAFIDAIMVYGGGAS